MGKLFRTLLITAAATGAAAFVLTKFQEPAFPPPKRDVPPRPPAPEPDEFTDEQVQALTDELAAQL